VVSMLHGPTKLDRGSPHRYLFDAGVRLRPTRSLVLADLDPAERFQAGAVLLSTEVTAEVADDGALCLSASAPGGNLQVVLPAPVSAPVMLVGIDADAPRRTFTGAIGDSRFDFLTEALTGGRGREEVVERATGASVAAVWLGGIEPGPPTCLHRVQVTTAVADAIPEDGLTTPCATFDVFGVAQPAESCGTPWRTVAGGG